MTPGLAAAAAPVAEFSGSPTIGAMPLEVSFTDSTTGSPTGWAWFFGDETYTEPWALVNGSAGWTGRSGPGSVVMPDGTIVLMGGYTGGFTNDVWRSTDNGVTWSCVNTSPGWSARCGQSSVLMPDGSIILMGSYNGGYTNDVWRSTDRGSTWTEVKPNNGAGWSKRAFQNSVVTQDGTIILMGGSGASGFTNDVWNSTDYGATWTQVKPNNAVGWSARCGHSSILMPDESILLLGCWAEPTRKNDVWRSSDRGATWTEVKPNNGVGWSARYDQSCVLMPDNSIVLMGGNDGALRNDIWRSMDNGTSWSCVNVSAGWSPRADSATFLMPDSSILLCGGYTGSVSNEVWRLQPSSSSIQNPQHIYPIPGTYNISLQAFNADGYNNIQKTGYIRVDAVPIASFSATPLTGMVPLTVQFNDTTTGGTPTAWNWSFGDGSWFNTTEVTLVNTSHTYTIDGSFTPRLTVSNASGSNTCSGTPITVFPQPPVASITASPTTGILPLTVQFNDTSTGGKPTAWNWSFGDTSWYNTTDSTLANTTWVYSTEGTYNATLTVSNPGGSSTSAVTAITVLPVPPVASFTAFPLNGSVPLDILFNDTSAGGAPTVWNWSFGDGSWFNTTDATQRNTTYRFGSRGQYMVTLTVSNPGGSNTTTPGTTVTATGPPTAAFSYSPSTGYAPLPVQFNDTSTCDTYTSFSAWNWSFAGGTSWSNFTDPARRNLTHTFPVGGVYTCILTVFDANEGNRTVNHTITVLQPTMNITGNTPAKGTIGTTVPVTIAGTNFTSTPAMRVNLTRGPEVIQATEVKVTVPNKIACKFMIPLGASGGSWNLTVTRPDGDYGTKTNAFNVSVLKDPKISALNPTSGYVNSTTAFSLAGSNFIPGSVVTFSNSNHAITAVLDPITKSSKITGNLTTNASSPLGKWNITIVLPDGRSSIKTYAFTLKPWTKPAVSNMMPSSGNPNMTYTFSVSGNLFENPGTAVVLTRGVPGEFIPTTLTSVNLKKITGTVFIPAGTAEMKWNLSVTTPDGGTTIKNGAFTVKPWPKPGISSINQTKGIHGSTISYAISGTNFQPGSTVTFTNSSAAGLNFTAGVSTLTASKMTGAVTIPANRIGKYGIEVLCPDGKVASKANAFTVT